ncbi:MAG: putative N-acetylmannosamine-6-phosphate 2-epimerase [Anaerolineae bacterium]|nr:putative N-acetylmannosamine-6-phosphate 2-epimerase [Anaerolineae bacterium]NUQ03087.1 putative N-acetylmannosamine-6-phosphate 2-epimerase [Anaerolineae bacterium]
MHPAVERLRGGLIVSCQAGVIDALYGPEAMAKMALAAHAGGAVGIRTNGREDVAAIRRVVSLPIIGIDKQEWRGLGIRITPTLEAARTVVEAGADIVAVDATRRAPEDGRIPPAELIRLIHDMLNVPVMADVATLDEGLAAAEAGADIVASTLSGYTDYSHGGPDPDYDLVRQLAARLQVPVVAEGRVAAPAQARHLLEIGAYAVVVGSMITKPRWITDQYASAMRSFRSAASQSVVGVDIGGTKIAVGVVDSAGQIVYEERLPTQAQEGGEAVLRRAGDAVERALRAAPAAAGIGASTGGVIDDRGRVIFATDSLPGWAGMDIRGTLAERFGLPVAVENDGQAAALAEALLGAGRGFRSVLGVTVGTGIGGGFVVDGRIYRGGSATGIEPGHIAVVRDGRLCPCGRHGCLEAYASGGCLTLEYNARADAPLPTGEAVVAAAERGDAAAVEAIQAVAGWLGYGLASAVNLLNPSVIVIGGGVAQIGDLYLEAMRAALRRQAYMPLREVPLRAAALRNREGIVGAALVGRQAL